MRKLIFFGVTVFTIAFVDRSISQNNVSNDYVRTYRTFTADSIALSHDNFGKLGKFVVRKPDKVYFCVTVTVLAESATGLHMEFGNVIDTAMPFYTIPPSTKVHSDSKLGKWDFTFGNNLYAWDTVQVIGYGIKAKLQTVSKYFWRQRYTQVSAIQTNPTIDPNVLKMPMPNRVNGLVEAFSNSGFSVTNGLMVGENRTDSVKNYGWLLASQYTDVLNSLSDKKGLQSGTPRGFDVYTSSRKPILGRQKSITPSKQNNKLIADMIALKLNIVLSEMGITSSGFGELIYNDSTANPLNSLMVKEIADLGDSLMMGYCRTDCHEFVSLSVFANLDNTIEKINNAFEGPIDTIRFSGDLRFKGTRSLADVPYLFANPNVIPAIIVPMEKQNHGTPMAYQLYQNYPNPFNPSTTIQFEIPNPSVVTVKVYNILGQEVAALLDNTAVDKGMQSLNFNASHLASGVYLYRIVAQRIADPTKGIQSMEFTSMKKMILLK